jgi:hypothetical protein
VKLFAPATGAAVVELALLVATAGGIVEGAGVVVWARRCPAPIVLRSRAVAQILFMDVLPREYVPVKPGPISSVHPEARQSE